MNYRALAGLAALAAIAATSTAQQAAETSLEASLATWRAAHGDAWRMHVNPSTGRADYVGGGSVEPAFHPESDADYYALARMALADASDLHGIDAATLFEERVLLLPLSHVGTTDKVSVRYVQGLDGVPVDSGFMNVLLDTGGRVLAIQTTAIPGLAGLETSPALAPAQAQRRATAFFRAATGLPADEVSEPELVIHLARTGEVARPVLCWKVDTFWYGPDAEPEGRTWFVDAGTGREAGSAEAIHFFDVSGTVSAMASPGTLPDSGSNPEQSFPAGYVQVSSSAGTVTADVNGNFTFVGPGSVNNVNVGFVGSWADVSNQGGADYNLAAGTLSGSGNNLLMNPLPTALITAEANAFINLNTFRDYVRAVVPGDSSMDFQADANVNINNSCNAFFNGSSTNYYIAGGNCPNTSYSTVVAHEQGHWANVIYGTGNGGDGMGEGNADVWSMFQHETPIVGQNFCGAGCHVRNALTANTWCGNGCYNQVHADGEVWMGTAWRIRRNLKVTHGDALGIALTDALFMGWMNGYDQQQILPVIEEQWLALDDDNGNINDGTPNYLDIDQAFREQNFPGFGGVEITSVTELPDTTDEVGPYTVTVSVLEPLLTATAARVLYRVGGGAFIPLNMADIGGGNYSTGIPGQAAPAIVEYYVEVDDSGGGTSRHPEDAIENLVFVVGTITEILNDNFESDLGWTVTGTPDAGDFERANPQQTTQSSLIAQPENDNPNGTGTMCYVTGPLAGTSVGTHDVDEGPTRVISPVFDLSGGEGIITYAYWFYSNGGNTDSLDVYLTNTGGSPWTLVRRYEDMLGGWREDSLVVSQHLTPTDQMQIRFVTSDVPNDGITEALVDDVVVRSIGPVGPVCDATNYCSTQPNSSGFPGMITSSGTTSVAANNFSLTLIDGPPGQSVLAITSPDEASVPLGNGTLCVGTTTLGFVVRLLPGTIDVFGTFTHAIDATNMPPPINVINPGEIWKYQFWFRDVPGGGAFFNFSDALSVLYCP